MQRLLGSWRHGAMLIVLWDLPADPASSRLRDLRAFLGLREAAVPG
ncbi:MAG: hypothetical protein WCD80_00855 [Desulfobaccales bacterium]